jgi:hypothetical protein
VSGVWDLAVGAGAGEVRRRCGAVGGGEVPVCLAVECDGGDADRGLVGQPSFDLVVGGVSGREAESVTVGMDDDVDVVVVVERAGYQKPASRSGRMGLVAALMSWIR